MDEDSEHDVDLFGLPVPKGRGKRGRPSHFVTPESTRKVNMLLAFGRTDAEIAAALNISEPTLRKHYFSLLKRKADARLQAEAWLLSRIAEQIEEGSVPAMKELGRRFDKFDMALLAERTANRGRDEDEARPSQKKGKKEQQREAAGRVSGIYAPPEAPGRLM